MSITPFGPSGQTVPIRTLPSLSWKTPFNSITAAAVRITAPGFWNAEQLLFLGIILLGVILRLAKITHEFDPDEVFSAKVAGRSFLRMLESSLNDRSHPPLYYFLLWIWKRIMGPSEVATRLFSIALFVPFLFATRHFLRDFCSRTGIALTLFLLATSPFFVFYGQQTRLYSLLALLLAANLAALSNVCIRQDRKSYLLWFLSCALLVHTQYLSVVFIALASIVALLSGRIPPLRFLAYTLAGLVTVMPWVVAAFWDVILHGEAPLPQITWIRRPTLDDVQWFYASVFHHGENSILWFYEFIVDHLGKQYKYFILLVISIATAVFTFRLAARKIPFKAVIVLAYAFIPPLIFYLVSTFGPKSIFLPRQLLGTAFGCIILLGAAVPDSRPRTARFYIAACIVYGLISCSNIVTTDIRLNHKDMATYIVETFGNQTIVTQDDWDHLLPMVFYMDRPAYSLDVFNATHEELLFLCENGNCEEVYTGTFRSRATHLKSVTWGNEPWPCTLNLFKINAASATSNP